MLRWTLGGQSTLRRAGESLLSSLRELFNEVMMAQDSQSALKDSVMLIYGKQVDTGEVITLTLAEGKIAAIAPGVPTSTEGVLGGSDLFLAPGFFDLQINGYGGSDFNVGIWGSGEEIHHDPETALRHIVRSGTALFCPTIITNSAENILAAFVALARLRENSPLGRKAIPGFHLEGPYISSEDGPRGAHPLRWARDPDWQEFQRFQEAAGGNIRLCTLAPEREGALTFIEKLTESGVVAAIGHTAASPETIRDALQAGARLATHLGNGSHALQPRHSNYFYEQLADDTLYASVIADGFHLPDSLLKVICRVKSVERLALVSDAVSLGGMPPGCYAEGRYEVLSSGKIVTAGTPYLAGAGYLLDRCIPLFERASGLTLGAAIHCTTAVPAKILGLSVTRGRLEIGYDADITLFRRASTPNAPLDIVATLCGGNVAYPV